jgi:hypothetical protein
MNLLYEECKGSRRSNALFLSKETLQSKHFNHLDYLFHALDRFRGILDVPDTEGYIWCCSMVKCLEDEPGLVAVSVNALFGLKYSRLNATCQGYCSESHESWELPCLNSGGGCSFHERNRTYRHDVEHTLVYTYAAGVVTSI